MPIPKDIKRRAEIVRLYKSGLSLRKVAARLGITMQRVHFIVKEDAGNAMREPYRVTK